MVDELPAPVADTAVEHIDRAVGELDAEPAEPVGFVDPGSRHGTATLRYLEALLEGRRNVALNVIQGLVDDGTSLTDIYEQVLQPALAEIGRLWHLGEVAIADEHFATSVTETVMSMLRCPLPGGRATGSRLLLAASIGGEMHGLGVRMVADFFEMDGWDVYLLGANTPSDAIVDAVQARRPDVLALSVISSLNVRALGDTIARLRADPQCAGVPILVGGPPLRIAADLWRELGADGCAGSASESVQAGNQLAERAKTEAG